ncbi:probable sodium/potassium/calcium exchanger CG1090 isoform X2 [Cylas formicarius]|nr:probable sodium/potassium/calcium exchanger CG1090 isoform X2 [Cylas formicarius]
MPPDVRKHGGLILHIIIAIYMFVGLAIVCDEYFVASLDRICEELKMAPDVAGATFMAAGSSAPELATVIIGVFYAEDDIGISGVIGSAVFNIMFVISVCALVSGTVVYLNWWPLVRDSIFYAISILVMLAVIGDEYINWIESTVMLITYLIYCIVLHYNTGLEKWAHSLPIPFKNLGPTEQSGLVTYKNLDEDGKHTNYGMENSPSAEQQRQQQHEWHPSHEYQTSHEWQPGQDWSPEKTQADDSTMHNQLSGPDLNRATNETPSPRPQVATTTIQQDYYKPKEYDPSTKINPLLKPEDSGIWTQIKWYALYPIHFFCIYTMPDCRSDKYKNWYPFTFVVSMLWISFYSYFMVWMITIIGYTLGIPDTVMGLTFVAAGVSVPDALSSIAVIKEGYGDMAVSNAIGSNVFDILICLGLPWFLKTAIVQPGIRVRVLSKGLTYSTFSLLSTVIFLVVAIHYNGWKLDRKFGIVLMIWYLVFITFASLYELNIFGEWNPRECPTDWLV